MAAPVGQFYKHQNDVQYGCSCQHLINLSPNHEDETEMEKVTRKGKALNSDSKKCEELAQEQSVSNREHHNMKAQMKMMEYPLNHITEASRSTLHLEKEDEFLKGINEYSIQTTVNRKKSILMVYFKKFTSQIYNLLSNVIAFFCVILIKLFFLKKINLCATFSLFAIFFFCRQSLLKEDLELVDSKISLYNLFKHAQDLQRMTIVWFINLSAVI
ncbi:hypothetical protein ACJX0J_005960 [Zea mays]